jgi:hypothetical protein
MTPDLLILGLFLLCSLKYDSLRYSTNLIVSSFCSAVDVASSHYVVKTSDHSIGITPSLGAETPLINFKDTIQHHHTYAR